MTGQDVHDSGMDLRGTCDQATRLRSPRISFRISHYSAGGLNLQCTSGVIPRVWGEVNRAIKYALRNKGIIQPPLNRSSAGAGRFRAARGRSQWADEKSSPRVRALHRSPSRPPHRRSQ